MSILIPFALYQNRCVTVDEVKRGDSGARCPDCERRLIARHGDQNIHHFAHKVNNNCTSRGETALHRLAKECFIDPERRGKRLHLLDLNRTNHYGGVDFVIRKAWSEYPIKQIKKRVDVLLKGELVCPDKQRVPCYIAVEVCVTHPKTSDDVEQYRKVSKLSAVIEIDLSMDEVVDYWHSNPSKSLKSHVSWMLMSGPKKNRRWLVKPRFSVD